MTVSAGLRKPDGMATESTLSWTDVLWPDRTNLRTARFTQEEDT